MSETQEALAPQFDAPVISTDAQPDGAEQQAENAADSSPAAAPSKTSDTIEPETSRLSERFAELTRLRRDAERDRDHWRELAIRERQKPAEVQAPPLAEKPKTLADFNFDEVQHQAYIAQTAARAATEAAKRELRAEQEAARKQSELSAYVARVKEFAKDKPDFNDVANYAPISDQIAEMVIRSEQGPELAYHLGKNPDIAASLSALPPQVAAYELGMLSARLKYNREQTAKAKTVLSQAPPPAPRIEGAGDGGPKAKPDDPESDKTLTDAEWTRRRNAQVAAKQRARNRE
jgi:hypothetical protein